MNYPADVQHLMDYFHGYAAWDIETTQHRAAKHALKMEVALRMVLLFHQGGHWQEKDREAWLDMQTRAGINEPRDEATTRVLCDTIRSVLGMEGRAP